MSELRCTRCRGCFYGICRRCDAPRSGIACDKCEAFSREHFCPGQTDGTPHIDTRTQCDCCKTVAFFHQRIATPGVPPLDPKAWKKWQPQSGPELDLCPDCWAALMKAISVAVDALFVEREAKEAGTRWLPATHRIQFEPTTEDVTLVRTGVTDPSGVEEVVRETDGDPDGPIRCVYCNRVMASVSCGCPQSREALEDEEALADAASIPGR